MKILLAEDEENLLDVIRLNLELEGYSVTACRDGKCAVQTFKPGAFNLVLLDVMLPELNGFDVCEVIRRKDVHVPVLFLTAKGASEDRVKGLKIGADDYLVKPFNLEELLLRVNKLLKRSFPTAAAALSEYSFESNKINFLTYEITGISGQKHTLTKREAQLLKLLIEKKNQVVSRDEILEKLWGEDIPTARAIDNYILMFRKYFEKNPRQPRHFHSIRGVGYKFTD